MIDKETQDQAWAVLSAEQRKKCRECYKRYAPQSAGAILAEIFGFHNLTSDAEPEEVLTVPRKKVQEIYARCEEIEMDDSPNLPADVIEAACAKTGLLQELFGSKCLPDEAKDEAKDTPNDDSFDTNVDTLAANVDSSDDCKAEPKFKVGDKVRIIYGDMHKGKVAEIVYVDLSDYIVPYKVDLCDEEGGGKWYREVDLEPYTEPTQTNDNTENKYFCNNGSCPFNGVDYLEENQCDKVLCSRRVPKQMQKRWRAEKYQGYYYVDVIGGRLTTKYDTDEYDKYENNRYDSYNYFRTKELAQQAAEAVKATLEQFHKDNQQ